ncbi:MAG: energy-coupling factor transporter ATPase [Dethiobacter sp.]|nr:energy-coupling factor transporter ATPase [Dethiobacter sp.]
MPGALLYKQNIGDRRYRKQEVQAYCFPAIRGGVCPVSSEQDLFIRAERLRYRYTLENGVVEALSGIDLEIGRGEYVAVIGPNGSGKTTLLKHFNALLKPSAGTVIVSGLSTADEENFPAIRRQCGMIFQNPDNQLVATTVEEDIAFGLENLALPSRVIRDRVCEVMRALNLSGLEQHPPHLLSGGEKQRVAIAGVLAMRPQCLLMDEPTAMLDPAGQREVLEAARKLNSDQGINLIHVTHFPEEAALAGRVLVMDQGQVVRDGPPVEVLTDISLLHRLGLQSTVSAELAFLLRQGGMLLPAEILHDWELSEALCAFALKI